MTASEMSGRRARVRRRWVAAVVCTAWLLAGGPTLAPAAIAHADCSAPGDFGAGSGCPPPDDSSGSGGGGENWPPTSIDWPPSQSDDSGDGGDKGGVGDGGEATPIVMPAGQQAPPTTRASATASTNTTSDAKPPTPIVAVGASPAAPDSKPIVMPGGG